MKRIHAETISTMKQMRQTPCPSCGRTPTLAMIAAAVGVSEATVCNFTGLKSRQTPYVPGDPVSRVRALTNAIGARE